MEQCEAWSGRNRDLVLLTVQSRGLMLQVGDEEEA